MDGEMHEVSQAIGALQATTSALREGLASAEASRRITHEKVDAILSRLGAIEGIAKDVIAMKPSVDQCAGDHKALEEMTPKVDSLMTTRVIMFTLLGAVAMLAVVAGHGPVAKVGEFILALFGML